MKGIKISNECSIEVYASVKELPIELSKRFNSYLLQDAGIGNSIEDIDDHLAKIMLFLSNDKKAEAIEEAKNLRFNMFSMLSKWDYKSAAFGCLVATVNGHAVKDYSSEGLQKMVNNLSEQGLKQRHVGEIIDEVKKNWTPNEN